MDRTPFPSLVKLLDEWVLGRVHRVSSERRVEKRVECAEVVALTYQRMGLLPPEPPPNTYTPRDFSAQHTNLRLLNGATLGPQLEVLWSGMGASAPQRPRA